MESKDGKTSFFITFCIAALSLYLLIAGQELLIPFVIAIVIWYLIISIASAFRRIPLAGPYIPRWLSLIAAVALCLWTFYFVVELITDNITQLISIMPSFQERFFAVLNDSIKLLGIKNPPDLSELFKDFNLTSFFTNIAQTTASIAGSTGIILIYVIFLLLEYESFDQKLAALIPDKGRLDKAQRLIRKISQQIQTYVRIHTLLSMVTAFACYGVLVTVGVELAEFWAMMVFLLNYIPTIGSIIATIFPCAMALIQFDSWTPFVIVTLSLTAIHMSIGNILEPRLIGRSVNLSGLVIILSLTVWGAIWGIAGMFLSVPIMVILNLIFANFPSTRPIAVILSQDGKLD